MARDPGSRSSKTPSTNFWVARRSISRINGETFQRTHFPCPYNQPWLPFITAGLLQALYCKLTACCSSCLSRLVGSEGICASYLQKKSYGNRHRLESNRYRNLQTFCNETNEAEIEMAQHACAILWAECVCTPVPTSGLCGAFEAPQAQSLCLVDCGVFHPHRIHNVNCFGDVLQAVHVFV